MPTLTYATATLPAEYGEQARVAHWQNFAETIYGALDCTPSGQRAFSVNLRFAQFGNVCLGDFVGSVTHMSRARCINASDMFTLVVGRGDASKQLQDSSREALLTPGSVALLEGTGRNSLVSQADIACMSVHFPKRSLLDLVPDAEDRFCEIIADTPAARHLYRYLDFASASDDIGDSPQLGASVATTMVDLIALTLGGGRDAVQIANGRGLRAARIHDILQIVQKRFADPTFCANVVATRLNVTPRYVQQLLQESGSTFSERVLELRLQKARRMLEDSRCDYMRVGEIALACGFSDASYFNRCFRRRFGAAPMQYRGGGLALH